MFVKSILDNKGPELITVSPGDALRKVARLFRSERIGFALVDNGNKSLIGTVSERDIVQAMAEYGDLSGLPVADVMTTNVVVCEPEDTLETVRELMTERRTRHVVVIDMGRPVGIVSIGDLIKHSLSECRVDSVQMRDYITGVGYQ